MVESLRVDDDVLIALLLSRRTDEGHHGIGAVSQPVLDVI